MNYRELSEQELIDLFISGDESCIKELFRRHKSRVYTYIMLIVKDRELAEDFFSGNLYKGYQITPQRSLYGQRNVPFVGNAYSSQPYYRPLQKT